MPCGALQGFAEDFLSFVQKEWVGRPHGEGGEGVRMECGSGRGNQPSLCHSEKACRPPSHLGVFLTDKPCGSAHPPACPVSPFLLPLEARATLAFLLSL